MKKIVSFLKNYDFVDKFGEIIGWINARSAPIRYPLLVIPFFGVIVVGLAFSVATILSEPEPGDIRTHSMRKLFGRKS